MDQGDVILFRVCSKYPAPQGESFASFEGHIRQRLVVSSLRRALACLGAWRQTRETWREEDGGQEDDMRRARMICLTSDTRRKRSGPRQ